ncbi:SHD1 domain-containing protein [Bythopirellula polymerisocia]|uniref:SLA1 homology domain-containing protein n=1 Tax=Bythopirellula polymerisocia TaxID=2528003 RepID=A0A5C6CY64_9BACT|nr:SHD1 domain-containing protein [Bythopirellula polymerisocia]TWU29873.1 hypothetical protein Pla144_06530 [Bythopirellula polymerisocia]
MLRFMISMVLAATWFGLNADARVWTDKSGNYSLEGDLVAFDGADVVIQKTDKTLVGVDMEQLSEKDQEYAKSEEAKIALEKAGKGDQVWEMRNGLKVIGKVVDYMRRDVTFRMARGTIFVNDVKFENLPEVYQKIAPLVAAHFTERDITDRAGLFDWLRRVRGAPQTFTTEGVLMELSNGNHYAVPFFLFSEKALLALKPGWDRWAASAQKYEDQQESALYLQSQAQAFQQSAEQTAQFQKLQLQLQAYTAGMFSLWEVVLYPNQGTPGTALSVVVPGRNSRQAQITAMEQNPGYSLGPVARVNRQF